MNSPLSTYELLYKALSDEERERLQGMVTSVLKQSAEEGEKMLTEAIQKAVTAMYNHRYSNPWYALLQENADLGGLIEAVADFCWKNMLKSSPAKLFRERQWSMKELVKAWRRDFPGEWEEVCSYQVEKDMAHRAAHSLAVMEGAEKFDQKKYTPF